MVKTRKLLLIIALRYSEIYVTRPHWFLRRIHPNVYACTNNHYGPIGALTKWQLQAAFITETNGISHVYISRKEICALHSLNYRTV